jgi:hypothetical protein
VSNCLDGSHSTNALEAATLGDSAPGLPTSAVELTASEQTVIGHMRAHRMRVDDVLSLIERAAPGTVRREP